MALYYVLLVWHYYYVLRRVAPYTYLLVVWHYIMFVLLVWHYYYVLRSVALYFVLFMLRFRIVTQGSRLLLRFAHCQFSAGRHSVVRGGVRECARGAGRAPAGCGLSPSPMFGAVGWALGITVSSIPSSRISPSSSPTPATCPKTRDFDIMLWTRSIVVQVSLLWDHGAAGSAQVNSLRLSDAIDFRCIAGFRFKFAFARNTGLIASISTGDISTES